MNGKLFMRKHAPTIVMATFYLVGLVGHLVSPLKPWMVLLTPVFLWLSGLAVAVASVRGLAVREWVGWVAPVLVATFALEAFGVATGAIFGGYSYSEVLGARVLGVPPVIGWNWVLVVWGIQGAVTRLWGTGPTWARAVAVGLMCVVFDAVLEPVAKLLGYWTWDAPQVPAQNYVAWGVIATVASLWASRFPRLTNSGLPTANVVLQTAFFAGIGIGSLMW